MIGGAGHDNAQIIQPVLTGYQCTQRIEPHIALAQMWIVRADIRRIADDQIEPLLTEPGIRGAMMKNDIADRQALRIILCHRERGRRHIRSRHVTARPFVCHCECNRAAARAQIDDLHAASAGMRASAS